MEKLMRWTWRRGAIAWTAIGLLALLALLGAAVPKRNAPSPERSLPEPIEAPGLLGDLAPMNGATSQFSGVAAPQSIPQSLGRAARKVCAGLTCCSVHLWSNEFDWGLAIPMVDRQVATQVSLNEVNRVTAFERALYDCKCWPTGPAKRDSFLYCGKGGKGEALRGDPKSRKPTPGRAIRRSQYLFTKRDAMKDIAAAVVQNPCAISGWRCQGH